MKFLKYLFLFVCFQGFSQGAIIFEHAQEISRKQASTGASVERTVDIILQASEVEGSTDLTNFPVLITQDMIPVEAIDNGSNSAAVDGQDIQFYSGATRLPMEISAFTADATPANRECLIWVNVPTVSATVNTTIEMRYNAARTQPASDAQYGSEEVWSDWLVVTHDIETNSVDNTLLDDRTGAKTATGPFGEGLTTTFDGNDKHRISMSGITSTPGYTMIAWIKYSDTGTFQRAVQFINSDAHFVIVKDANRFIVGLADGANGVSSSQSSESTGHSTGTWYHVALEGDNDGSPPVNDPDAIVDGTTNNNDAVGLSNGNNGQELNIGGRADDGSYFNGDIAEVWFGNIRLTQDYIKTLYNNQSSPSTFGIEQTPGNAN